MLKVTASFFCVGLAIVSAGCPGGGAGGGGGNGNVNSNTNDNSAGEDGTVFRATLDGAQEVPPVETEASGSGTATLSVDESRISFRFTASGLSGPVIAAHFHVGTEGEDGPIRIEISASVSQADDEVVVEGEADVTSPAFPEDLSSRSVYINLHTELNPDGEIRGQLEAAP